MNENLRDERRPGLDGPGRMVKSRGLDGKISYLTKIWGFAKGLIPTPGCGAARVVLLLLPETVVSPFASTCRAPALVLQREARTHASGDSSYLRVVWTGFFGSSRCRQLSNPDLTSPAVSSSLVISRTPAETSVRGRPSMSTFTLEKWLQRPNG